MNDTNLALNFLWGSLNGGTTRDPERRARGEWGQLPPCWVSFLKVSPPARGPLCAAHPCKHQLPAEASPTLYLSLLVPLTLPTPWKRGSLLNPPRGAPFERGLLPARP